MTVDALNDRIYTGNLGGGGISSSVSVLERGNNVLIAAVNVPGPVRSVAVNPYAHQLFAAGDGGVFVVGEQSRSVMRTIPAGLPFSVATPSGLDRQLYVGDLRTGELTRLSYSSGSRQ